MGDGVKCLVWDLDNTLWRGTALEAGSCRLRPGVRRVIEELDRRGVLQSVASRNEPEQVVPLLRRKQDRSWRDGIEAGVDTGDPNEPTFRAVDFLGRVAPIPILMVQSTGDQFISEDKARQLFSVAREPKKFITIKAQNHRFAGNQGELFRTVNEGLQWIKMAPR